MPIISLSFVLELAYVSEMTKREGFVNTSETLFLFPPMVLYRKIRLAITDDSVWCQCFAEGCDGFL